MNTISTDLKLTYDNKKYIYFSETWMLILLFPLNLSSAYSRITFATNQKKCVVLRITVNLSHLREIRNLSNVTLTCPIRVVDNFNTISK